LGVHLSAIVIHHTDPDPRPVNPGLGCFGAVSEPFIHCGVRVNPWVLPSAARLYERCYTLQVAALDRVNHVSVICPTIRALCPICSVAFRSLCKLLWELRDPQLSRALRFAYLRN